MNLLEKYLNSLSKKDKLFLYGTIFFGTLFISYQTVFQFSKTDLQKIERKLKFRKNEMKNFYQNISTNENLIKEQIREKRKELLHLERINLSLSQEMNKIPKKLNNSQIVSKIYQHSDEVGVKILKTNFVANGIELIYFSSFEDSLFFINYFERKRVFQIENLKIEANKKEVITSFFARLF